jgi:hypothetical protein
MEMRVLRVPHQCDARRGLQSVDEKLTATD